MKRILLALSIGLVVLLLVEGALSLFMQRSLRPRLFSDTVRFMQTDVERFAAAASQPGLYRHHGDPLVRYVLKFQDVLDADTYTITPTKGGWRARPQGPVPKGAQRIVVLGDSVAFGRGVGDQDTIACHLEAVLAQARGPEAPPVACLTVALCRWNHRNAVQFLIDNFKTFDPDIVLYMPIPNDLTDSFGVNESGHLTLMSDSTQHDPLLQVNMETRTMYKYWMTQRLRRGDIDTDTTEDDLGPLALTADLSLESKRRFDDNAQSIAKLAELLERNGVKLMLMHYFDGQVANSYVKVLRARLLDMDVILPEAALFTKVPLSCRVAEFDVHPGPLGARAVAIWAAEELLKRNWVSPGAGNPLPPPCEEAVASRTVLHTEAEVRRLAKEIRQKSRDRLQNTVNVETARGTDQVYGGMNFDGTLAPRFLTLVKADGPSLCVKLGALEEVTHIYPLEVDVEVDGVHLGHITVPAAHDKAAVEKWFDLLPERKDPLDPIEVRLSPENWVVRTVDRKALLASCRLISISCPQP